VSIWLLVLLTCTAVVVYTYALFPVLLAVRAWLRPRRIRAGDVTPRLSVIVAAHDEEEVIGDKLTDVLASDYPADAIEVIVVSDGSTDATEAAVRRCTDPRVQLLALPRVGKATALNEGIRASTGEVLVFTDANSRLAPTALRALVGPLADPTVGGVAGDQRYVRSEQEGGTADGESRYWDYDRFLKLMGSRGGNVTSATGALYAIRRQLADPVPDGVTDDFFLSTGVVAKGARLVFEPTAVASEPVAPGARVEYGRKVRVMTRGFYAIRLRRQLLDPRLHGFYALQLFTHKVLRRTMALPVLAIGASSLALWDQGLLFRLLAAGQIGFYVAAAAGAVLSMLGVRGGPLLKLPAYFCMVNGASVVALGNALRGRRIDRWQTASRVSDVAARAAQDGAPVRPGVRA
jgi:cellulose synthase/poly-beta-1,6-N-acetylglucosamine synthase-like glycosyltransferase